MIAILATLDTKGAEASYTATLLREMGAEPLLIDTTPERVLVGKVPDIRGDALSQTGEAVSAIVMDRFRAGRVDGILAIGGASGAALVSKTFAALPLGIPKVLVSPVASGDTRPYIGATDVVTFHPVIDFIGRNRYVDAVLERAARVVLGLTAATSARRTPAVDVGITAFGITNGLVDQLRDVLDSGGHAAVCFSANGAGGSGYEAFIRDGRFGSVIDATTTEIGDELFGGMLSAGPSRLTAAAECNIPQIVLPGALDVLNFGAIDQIPAEFQGRAMIEHTRAVTLVRTSPQENEKLGAYIGKRLSQARAHFVIPLRGFSLVSAPGMPFEDKDADKAFLRGLRRYVRDDRITLVDASINDTSVVRAVMTAWSRLKLERER